MGSAIEDYAEAKKELDEAEEIRSKAKKKFNEAWKRLYSERFGTRGSLSNREAQVLELIKERMRNKEIAAKLVISERAVKFHVSNILLKYDVNSRLDLIGD